MVWLGAGSLTHAPPLPPCPLGSVASLSLTSLVRSLHKALNFHIPSGPFPTASQLAHGHRTCSSPSDRKPFSF